MKKRLLIVTVLLLSLALSFCVGVLSFSKDNLENVRNDYRSEKFSETSGLVFRDWTKTENGYVSGEDAWLVMNDIEAYVHNVRLDVSFEPNTKTVEIFYTESEEEQFSAEKYMVAELHKKNDDFYIFIDKPVEKLRIDIYSDAGKTADIREIVINPRNLNFNSLTVFILFFAPFLISYSLIEIIFDRKSFAKDILAMKRYKYLLFDLVTKDIKTKYRRSVLGVLWSVLNPLLMMLVLTAVFSNIIRVEVEGGFALFYLTGYIIFNFVSEATGFSLTTITGAAPLIKKVYIPKYVFPLQKCMFCFVNMLFSMIAFILVFVVFCITGSVTPHASMLLFPIPMIYTFIFALGLSLVLSALVVFFRDIAHIWGILLTVWMYGSPIIYPIEMVPDWLAAIIKINPLYHFIDYFRNVMIYGRIPGLWENAICLLYSVAVFLIGVVIFRKSQDKFVLYI